MFKKPNAQFIVALVIVAVVIAAIAVVSPGLQEGRFSRQNIARQAKTTRQVTGKITRKAQPANERSLLQRVAQRFQGEITLRFPQCEDDEICVVATGGENPEEETHTSFSNNDPRWITLSELNFQVHIPAGAGFSETPSGDLKLNTLEFQVGTGNVSGRRVRIHRRNPTPVLSATTTIENALAEFNEAQLNQFKICRWETTGPITRCNPSGGLSFVVQLEVDNDFIEDIPLEEQERVRASLQQFTTTHETVVLARQGTPAPRGNFHTFRHPQYTVTETAANPTGLDLSTTGTHRVATFSLTAQDQPLELNRVKIQIAAGGPGNLYHYFFDEQGVRLQLNLLGTEALVNTTDGATFSLSTPLTIPTAGALELPIDLIVTDAMLATIEEGGSAPSFTVSLLPSTDLRVRSHRPDEIAFNDRIVGAATNNDERIAGSEVAISRPVPPPVCGNGELEEGEFCDAGSANGTPGSGCTTACVVDTTPVCDDQCEALQALFDFGLAVNGTFLGRSPDVPTAYVFQNGALHGIPNSETLGSCMYGISPTPTINPVGATTFDNLPTGSVVWLGPVAVTANTDPAPDTYGNYARNGMFVLDDSPDSPDPGTVYRIDRCVRRGIPTPAVFEELGGPVTGVTRIDSALGNILRGDDY